MNINFLLFMIDKFKEVLSRIRTIKIYTAFRFYRAFIL